jgi:hypothetical protein
MNPAHTAAPRQPSPHVDLIYFDAGGGHRASALALKEVIEQRQRPWQVRLVNLREVLEPIDFIRRLTACESRMFTTACSSITSRLALGPCCRSCTS